MCVKRPSPNDGKRPNMVRSCPFGLQVLLRLLAIVTCLSIAKLSRKRALHFDQLSTPWGPEPAMDLVAAMQLVAAKSTELTNQAAEVEPVVDALVKAHVEFEVRLGRFKKAITK